MELFAMSYNINKKQIKHRQIKYKLINHIFHMIMIYQNKKR